MSTPTRVKVTAKLGSGSVTDALVDSVSYTDNAHGESDSVEFTLDNSSGKYLGSTKPKKGETVKLAIKQGESSVSAGVMYIDSFSASGGETEQVSISALSKPSYAGFSATERTHTYKKTTAKTILKKIASRNKTALRYSGPTIKIEKIKQDGATDSDFATDLCERYGLRIKVFNKKLVVYEAKKYAKKKAVKTLKKSDLVGDYDYTSDILGAYTSATNTYYDKKKKKDIKVKVGHPKYKTLVSYYYIAVTKRPIKARGSRSPHGKVLKTFPKGAKVRIVKRDEDGWAKVKITKKRSSKKEATSGSLAKLFSVAKSQIGYGDRYNSDGAPWCVDFVKWCFRHSGNSHKISGLTARRVDLLAAWGKRHYSYSRTPHVGDIAIFATNGFTHGHTEIVYKVVNNNDIWTIGGNTSWEGHGYRYRRKAKGYVVSMKHRINNSLCGFTGFIHVTWPKSDRTSKGKASTKSTYAYIYLGKSSRNAKITRKKKTTKKMINRNLSVDAKGYSKADAKRIAKAKLAKANESIETMTLSVSGGDKKLVASSNITLGKDWGGLKGKWEISQAQHSAGAGSAYTEELSLFRLTAGGGKKSYRKKGSKAKFRGGYVHTSAKGGKATKMRGGIVTIADVKKGAKYPYKIKSTTEYANWKSKKVTVKEYTRATGSGGRKLNSSCCACDWLPIGSKIKIGGKTYTVADRTHGKGGILVWKKEPSSAVKVISAKYKKLTKKAKVIGWVSGAELGSLTGAQKTKDKKKSAKVNGAHQKIVASHKSEFKVVKTCKASYSCYALPYPKGGIIRGRIGSWTGMCCAAPPSVPIGSFIRMTGTGSKWDGRVMKVVDRGGAIYVHPGGVYWIDVHFSAGSAEYREFLKKGRYSGRVQILKRVKT